MQEPYLLFHLYNSWRETVSLCLVLSSTQNREMQAENSLPRPGGPLPLCPEPLLVFLESLSASLMLLHFTMICLSDCLSSPKDCNFQLSLNHPWQKKDWINLSDEQMMNERGFLVWHASFGHRVSITTVELCSAPSGCSFQGECL